MEQQGEMRSHELHPGLGGPACWNSRFAGSYLKKNKGKKFWITICLKTNGTDTFNLCLAGVGCREWDKHNRRWTNTLGLDCLRFRSPGLPSVVWQVSHLICTIWLPHHCHCGQRRVGWLISTWTFNGIGRWETGLFYHAKQQAPLKV